MTHMRCSAKIHSLISRILLYSFSIGLIIMSTAWANYEQIGIHRMPTIGNTPIIYIFTSTSRAISAFYAEVSQCNYQ